jgi:2-amino-4-hydroxy-6-hydroxymethyldihydropteridine diphosphokinase
VDKATVYLGLGSNLGDRQQMLTQALVYLSQKVIVEKVSSFYETKPQYFANQPMFLNAVCRASTSLRPHQLLTLVKGIENKLGRLPDSHNKPRLVDIDILFYDNLTIQSQTLTIPHPLMMERAFVLIPLAEIAPDLVHPVIGLSISQLAKKVSSNGVVRIESAIVFPEGGCNVPDIS